MPSKLSKVYDISYSLRERSKFCLSMWLQECKSLAENVVIGCFNEASVINEPRREKTGLRGFRPGPTQTGLYKLRKELEA